jgi:hypothetical protein
MYTKTIKTFLLSAAVYSLSCSSLFAENFQVWIGPGYDSNVTRSVDDPVEDGYLNGNISWVRPAGPEKKLDWTLTGLLGSTAYFKTTEEDYISATLSPGVTYSPNERFHINISPLIEGSVVNDTSQSELTLGCGIYFSQQLSLMFYVGEYASYNDSWAKDDIYSQDEFSAGVYLGINLTQKLFAEAGYEYSYGTSYQTSSIPSGKGKGRHSTALNYDVYQDTVHEHALSLNAGSDLTEKIFTVIGYTFTYTEGEIGISRSNDISAGIGYRF